MTGTPSATSSQASTPRKIEWVKAKGGDVLNLPIAFDIETTSGYTIKSNVPVKVAFMYEWTMAIDDEIVIGRTWEEWLDKLDELIRIYEITPERRLVIYVHNLAFEFGFIGPRLEWETVFCNDPRKPIYAITKSGIEFRCSYLLSGYPLAGLGKRLGLNKAVGDLDYSLIRHSGTPLTDEEIGYCVRDVEIVVAYIRSLMAAGETIGSIPYTKTGFVRRRLRESCLSPDVRQSYRALICRLKLDVATYDQLRRAYAGGFTHASAFHVGDVIEGVGSCDLASAYPATMVRDLYPMSRCFRCDIESDKHLEVMLDSYCCLFDLELWGVRPRFPWDHIISASKCYIAEGVVADNGRIVSARHIKLTVVDVDYKAIREFYVWDRHVVTNFGFFQRRRLPTPLVRTILELYGAKTTLKDVAGREYEYGRAKEDVNSIYGACCTAVVRPEIVYKGGEWTTDEVDPEEVIERYNTTYNRVLFYAWGVWVSAYCRTRGVFPAILACGPDHVYTDTDSEKHKHHERHAAFFERYNQWNVRAMDAAMKAHGLPLDLTRPVTPTGKVKQLGVFEFEGVYDRFKTLGAKRYLSETGGTYTLTVAGVSKKDALAYLLSLPGDPFEHFDDRLHIPRSATGKLTHTYIEHPIRGTITDYLGNVGSFDELSCVHLEPADYMFSMAEEFAAWIRHCHTEEK